jgi:hypothetical protein
MGYIPAHALVKLKEYKYQGADKCGSLLFPRG